MLVKQQKNSYNHQNWKGHLGAPVQPHSFTNKQRLRQIKYGAALLTLGPWSALAGISGQTLPASVAQDGHWGCDT